MALNENRKLSPSKLDADRDIMMGIAFLTDYAPTNPAITIEALEALYAERDAAQTEEILAQQALTRVRIEARKAEWALHNALLAAKLSVLGQYGSDAVALSHIGLKRVSQRQRPVRRKKTGGD